MTFTLLGTKIILQFLQCSCYEPAEKLYYSAGYDPICIHCAEEVTVQDANAEFFRNAHNVQNQR